MFLLAIALSVLCAGCPKEAGPDADAVSTACLADDFKEGYRLMDEVHAAGKAIPDEVLAVCLDGNIDRVLETEKWDVIQTRLDTTRRVVGVEKDSSLVVALARADAVMGWTELTGRTCCVEDAADRFANLADQELGTRATEIVDEWYAKAMKERLAEGEMVITVDGRLVAVKELYEVLPRDGHADRIGKPIVLENVLLLAEDRSEPRRSSGDELAADLTSDAVDLSAHRLLLARRPGAHEATAAAIAWDDDARAMVAEIHPGTLHTCEGTGAEVKQGEESTAMLVLTACRAETQRTHDLFNRRFCDVCGTRGEREVCNKGFGRNDGQALQEATHYICDQLLEKGEPREDCQKHVHIKRTCGSNLDKDEETPEAAPAAE